MTRENDENNFEEEDKNERRIVEIDDNGEEILNEEQELEESRHKANTHKEIGNKYFQEGEWVAAIDEYSEAISACHIKLKEELSIYHSNRAAAYFKLENYQQVVKDCDVSLELNEKNFKALFRRASAHEKLENYSLCLSGLIFFVNIY